MFRGNALAKVDDKGRLKLPAGFRSTIEPEYGRDFFVTSLRGTSVRIYPLQEYAKLEERLLAASSVKPVVIKLRTTLNYFGQSATMDAQGRILIHPLLRGKAGIDGEVAVLGQQNFLEVWNHRLLEKMLVDDPLTDENLLELAGQGL